MLEDLGCEIIGPIATLAKALEHCQCTAADAAVLNLVIEGKPAYSLASALAARSIPFGFASGTDHRDRDGAWKDRPFLAKPYSADGVRQFLLQVLPEHAMP